jgi:macrodomain Ter protein organizer (MatP/YcbG family)
MPISLLAELTIGNLIQVVVFIVSAIVAILSMRFEIRALRHTLKNVEQRQTVINEKYENLEQTLANRIIESEQNVGETIAAIRERVVQIELYMRDNFVRKETFSITMNELKNDVKNVGDKIEVRLLRIESKVTGRAR